MTRLGSNSVHGSVETIMHHDSSTSHSGDQYVKIPGCIGLYRHAINGRYYGVKKVAGKKKERSLETTDRKIAERRLKDWVDTLGKLDVEVEKTTLATLFQKLIAVTRGKSESSRNVVKAVVEDFEGWWKHGLDFQVRNIRPSHLEEWLAIHERRLKNTSYNRYAGVLKQAFELAVKDRIIAESPFLGVTTRWKKPQAPVRHIPTPEQFQAIVEAVRAEKNNSYAKDSANFIEFLGLAGLGQAEASSLVWGDVDMTKGRMTIRRHKTDVRFSVPIYAHLRPLMERLLKEAGGNPGPRTRVLKILDARKALTGACQRLGFPHFTQRNLRQSLIMRLWKAGIDRKLIAKFQGHQDGGQLILSTYTEVFGDDDAAYEQMQLAKLSESTPKAPANMAAEGQAV